MTPRTNTHRKLNSLAQRGRRKQFIGSRKRAEPITQVGRLNP